MSDKNVEVVSIRPRPPEAEVRPGYMNRISMPRQARTALERMAQSDIIINFETVLCVGAKMWNEADELINNQIPLNESPKERTNRLALTRQARTRAEESRRFMRAMTDVLDKFGKQLRDLTQQEMLERSTLAKERLADELEVANARTKKQGRKKG
jgi:hypothetical protein